MRRPEPVRFLLLALRPERLVQLLAQVRLLV